MRTVGRPGRRALWVAVVALLVAAAVAVPTAHRPPESSALAGLRVGGLVPGGALAGVTATGPSSTTTSAPPAAPVRPSIVATEAPTTTAAPVAPTTITTTAPPRAVAVPTTVRAARAVPRLPPPKVSAGLVPYTGLGAWSDVYDWSPSYTSGHPPTVPGDVDKMAAEGVQTLYIQASKWDAAGDLADPDALSAMVERAHADGLRVVGWYLPTLDDVDRDLQRLVAVAGFPHIDSVGVDIEARNVSDVQERNRRLISLSSRLRDALPGRTIAAIALPPVVLEVINQSYWPGFPYHEIAPSYDVWMTMGYWTNRTQAQGYRDAYRYTRENVDRLRADVGRADLPVHPIGGIGDHTTPQDIADFRRAELDVAGLGGSIYDWRTTGPALYEPLRAFRS